MAFTSVLALLTTLGSILFTFPQSGAPVASPAASPAAPPWPVVAILEDLASAMTDIDATLGPQLESDKVFKAQWDLVWAGPKHDLGFFPLDLAGWQSRGVDLSQQVVVAFRPVMTGGGVLALSAALSDEAAARTWVDAWQNRPAQIAIEIGDGRIDVVMAAKDASAALQSWAASGGLKLLDSSGLSTMTRTVTGEAAVRVHGVGQLAGFLRDPELLQITRLSLLLRGSRAELLAEVPANSPLRARVAANAIPMEFLSRCLAPDVFRIIANPQLLNWPLVAGVLGDPGQGLDVLGSLGVSRGDVLRAMEGGVFGTLVYGDDVLFFARTTPPTAIIDAVAKAKPAVRVEFNGSPLVRVGPTSAGLIDGVTVFGKTSRVERRLRGRDRWTPPDQAEGAALTVWADAERLGLSEDPGAALLFGSGGATQITLRQTAAGLIVSSDQQPARSLGLQLAGVARSVVPLINKLAEPIAYPQPRKIRDDLMMFASAASHYLQDHGRWPLTVKELLEPESGDPYLDEIPIDPWSNKPYLVVTTPDGFKVVSYGRDLVAGGHGPDEDVELFIPPDSR